MRNLLARMGRYLEGRTTRRRQLDAMYSAADLLLGMSQLDRSDRGL